MRGRLPPGRVVPVQQRLLCHHEVLRGGDAAHLPPPRVDGVHSVHQLPQAGLARHVRVRVEDHRPLRLLEQAAARGDVDSGLLLVPRDHPHLDPGLEKGGDGFGDTVLQLVLDGRDTHQLQVLLHLILQLGHLFLAAIEKGRCRLEAHVPVAIGSNWDDLCAQRQSAQALLRKHPQVAVGDLHVLPLLPRGEAAQDGVVCAFAEQPDGPVWAARHNAHALAVAAELNDVEELKAQRHALELQLDTVHVARHKDIAKLPGSLHQSDLIRRRPLVNLLAVGPLLDQK
mmetsp:Transcript_8499/g.24372  ORF Transcript_8499/g.24372 Transcript_8499/m.24372 type:complete len:285 (-) Transcript_8499:2460-3314(-)